MNVAALYKYQAEMRQTEAQQLAYMEFERMLKSWMPAPCFASWMFRFPIYLPKVFRFNLSVINHGFAYFVYSVAIVLRFS